jgi:hypothetical protein
MGPVLLVQLAKYTVQCMEQDSFYMPPVLVIALDHAYEIIDIHIPRLESGAGAARKRDKSRDGRGSGAPVLRQPLVFWEGCGF